MGCRGQSPLCPPSQAQREQGWASGLSQFSRALHWSSALWLAWQALPSLREQVALRPLTLAPCPFPPRDAQKALSLTAPDFKLQQWWREIFKLPPRVVFMQSICKAHEEGALPLPGTPLRVRRATQAGACSCWPVPTSSCGSRDAGAPTVCRVSGRAGPGP